MIFRCRPGYKLHGYKTNSCVSGHWSRDTPVCVGEELHSKACAVNLFVLGFQFLHAFRGCFFASVAVHSRELIGNNNKGNKVPGQTQTCNHFP